MEEVEQRGPFVGQMNRHLNTFPACPNRIAPKGNIPQRTQPLSIHPTTQHSDGGSVFNWVLIHDFFSPNIDLFSISRDPVGVFID